MSSDSGDALHIPIEIKTDDSVEIQQLINDLAAAESDIRSIKPRRGRGTGDTSSRSAFTSQDEEGSGIFGGMGGEALPSKGRDRTSKSPFQRENEFSKLKDQVQQQEQRIGLGQQAQQGIGMATQGVGFAQLIGSGGGAKLGAIAGIASKAFLPLAIVTSIMELAKNILQEFLKPGGPLDRRFKRVISEEIAGTISLEEKEEINQGFKVVRISTQPNIRGEAGVSSNLQSRTTIYDLGTSRSMAGFGG
tara:strand:- start:4146 stop:4889 length:744 start_codon:yes stop_codon:yes gene_type:complete